MASLFENDMLNKIWNNFQSIQQNPMNLVDILLVAFVVYEILVVIRKTRAAQLAKGAVVVLVVYALANLMNLRTVVWIMQSVLQIGFLALIVLFQPELRRALEQMGRTDKWAATLFKNRRDDPSLRAKWQNACLAICDAAEQLSDTRTGALIVLERNSNLSEIIRTGTPLNADVNREMLGTIFYEGTPLHDGAVVVRDGVLKAAGCVLPLSDNLEIGKDMGTRHRAALGMSENSDAVVVVVSEETGIISMAKNGVLIRRLDRQNLFNLLQEELVPPETAENQKQPFWRKKHEKEQQRQ
ncbi:diadenylate cyclase CdaA [Allofournierella sp.]|uniref:diadenylate cyclase CdaA n=1 Tax=Allofournierella sp. TaxID=1940256 RepID=UPI003AB5212C